jgi:hypothetical protein
MMVGQQRESEWWKISKARRAKWIRVNDDQRGGGSATSEAHTVAATRRLIQQLEPASRLLALQTLGQQQQQQQQRHRAARDGAPPQPFRAAAAVPEARTKSTKPSPFAKPRKKEVLMVKP